MDRQAVLGAAVTAAGLAHFVWPRRFEPLNRLGFPEDPRRFTYVNGSIETIIGLLRIFPRSRRAGAVLGGAYAAYLIGNVARARREVNSL